MVGVLVPLLDEIDNRPFPSCPLPLYQKNVFKRNENENLFCPHTPCHTNQTHFLIKGFAHALGLGWKQKHMVTWKWVIGYSLNTSCRIC